MKNTLNYGVMYTHWGHAVQQSKVVTLLLDNNRLQNVGEIEFEFWAVKGE